MPDHVANGKLQRRWLAVKSGLQRTGGNTVRIETQRSGELVEFEVPRRCVQVGGGQLRTPVKLRRAVVMQWQQQAQRKRRRTTELQFVQSLHMCMADRALAHELHHVGATATATDDEIQRRVAEIGNLRDSLLGAHAQRLATAGHGLHTVVDEIRHHVDAVRTRPAHTVVERQAADRHVRLEAALVFTERPLRQIATQHHPGVVDRAGHQRAVEPTRGGG